MGRCDARRVPATDPCAGRELAGEDLRRTEDPRTLGFTSTVEVTPLDGPLGQDRAVAAIDFGLGVTTRGYNIFVTAPAGTDARAAVHARLREHARGRPSPGDWVYLHNFAQPRRPIAVALATGSAAALATDMRRFVQDAHRELTSALDSEDYARRRIEATAPLEREQAEALGSLRRSAQEKGIALELTPSGVATVPLRGAHPMTPEEFGALPEAVRARYQASLQALNPAVQGFLTHMRALQREARDRLRALEREVTLFAVGHLIDDLRGRHAGTPELVRWLGEVTADVTENFAQFQAAGQEPGRDALESLRGLVPDAEGPAGRYEVNVFVAHGESDGAPVVVETNPTYPSLFGRIEHRVVLGGGLATDHRLPRPGALHRANGGYLVLPAAAVFTAPLVWNALKEVLRTGRLGLENPAEQFALLPTITLAPEPIELDVKVVLVGGADLYQLAHAVDEDFRELFRVKAEFDWRFSRDRAGASAYAGFLCAQARDEDLPPFDADAVAAVIEHGSRLVEDRECLSTSRVAIAGVATEAGHWARQQRSAVVRARHVEHAIERRIRRSDLLEQRLLEMIDEGALMIDVRGERIGQINGLAVLSLGDYQFGHPVRITATAGPGRGALVSIERETELSGHLHDKGFLTLSGYLRGRYGGERPIALAATVTFEQSYDRIDGDSASSAELYALLSAIAGVPVRQGIAVTGSVNQRGEVQAIGGVNEKIEGFYRACRLTRLSGRQGVIIPEANVRNLMLSSAVVDSVRRGRFHVWSVRSVDQGLELLTGVQAGRRARSRRGAADPGAFPEGSIHARVEERLERWAALSESAGAAAPSG